MKPLFIFILCCQALILSAQNFSGTIFMRDNSSLYLNQIFVTNLNTQKTVIADYQGKFYIPAKTGDKIRFTSVVSERKDVTLTSEMLYNRNNFIELTVAYIEIQEVVVNRFKVTGNLKKDVLSLKNTDKDLKLQKMIGLPAPKGDGTAPTQDIASFKDGGLSFNIESIYDAISGEKKKKERAYEYEKMKRSIEKIRSYYGDEYFTNLKIPKNLIDNFLMFVYTSDYLNFYLEHNKFENITLSLERFLPTYLKRIKNSHIAEIISN